ncbi:ribonuclease BN (tRNA processing enzyme) [Kribbella voronezhensis]|uniref:Ribonuclease BN (tRNA processing enzyme) n=1 Tax=Kribbella voronezhensis TaxID=2512212 RepID=A0A4V3FJ11_9ACTN|nr:MBL fold metallo-hydrolase [Kribbella voronezhensis]TDU84413.1 ribonuclease BN (tRNA processing enzyme) [Kribbella voronezhensis]
MRSLTVLGSCGAWPEPGRACAGFLLEYDGFRLVLDLGYAALPQLLKYCPDGEVDAVVVTHQHPDHCVDVSALARVRYYSAPEEAAIPLYCPPGVLDVLRALEPRPDPATVFDVHDLATTEEIGPFRLESVLLPHYVTNLGVRLSAPGLTVAYTGDSGPAPELGQLSAGADLYISDATLQGDSPTTTPRYVMTATEAGAGATAAKRLLLTHFWPGSDRALSVAEAQQTFPGEVIAAEEGLVIPL